MNEKKPKLTKTQRRENYIKKLKKELEYQKKLNEVMKNNVNKNYINKLDMQRIIEELQEKNCPMICECGICDELEKLLGEK